MASDSNQQKNSGSLPVTEPQPARRLGRMMWWNGKLVPHEEAKVSLFTHTLHYGMGAFEGIRCYALGDALAKNTSTNRRGVFRLQEHMERLLDSCKIIQLNVPYDLKTLVEAVKETVRQSGLEECYIRPLVYIGDGPLGVFPTFTPPVEVAIMTWFWGAYLGAEAKAKGARIKVSSFSRPHINSQMSKGKIVGHYVNSILAKMEAKQSGYDEALLLDTEGYVAEGSGENIFIFRRGILKTTPLPGVLEGITRHTLITLARKQGIEVREERFTRDEIYTADEAFFVGTAAELTPIRALDERLIGPEGAVGPVTQKLNALYGRVVRGQEPQYSNWITEI